MAKTTLKLLIDTNVLIPWEPTPSDHQQINRDAAAELHKISLESRTQIFIHPAAALDVNRDPDDQRRAIRRQSLSKYPSLIDPPSSATIEPIVGSVSHGTNDWVDQQLLAALAGNAVDYLVTEDRRLLRKARLLRVEDRVFTIAAAIAHLRALFDRAPTPPPAVRSVLAYALQAADPVFTSFRNEYGPEFEPWLQKCQREHRQTWVINVGGRHAAFAIVNEEDNPAERLDGKTVKICSFKVADDHRGFRFGELLLKAIFAYAEDNRYAWLFVTVFPHHDDLIALFRDFGFTHAADTTRGELKLIKPMSVIAAHARDLAPFDFHVRYGPYAATTANVGLYIVPIQPQYSDVLLPETAVNSSLFPGVFAFGNGIRKAYLCNAQTRQIARGDVLLFYRSQKAQGLIATGVVEQTLVSRDAEEIARVVGKRTVYRLSEIEKLADNGDVLVLMFRQSRILNPPIRLDELRAHEVIKSAPQSIASIGKGGEEWLSNRIAG